MNQRVAVNTLESCSGHQSVAKRNAKQRGGFHDQKRSQALTACQAAVTHGIEEPSRTTALDRLGATRQQPIKEILNVSRNRVEPRRKSSAGSRIKHGPRR